MRLVIFEHWTNTKMLVARMRVMHGWAEGNTPADDGPYGISMIYLDNNATTAPLPDVVDAVSRHMRDVFANPSSVHEPGQQARHAIERSRHSVGRLLGVTARTILFTSGGTEAVHTGIRGGIRRDEGRYRFITTATEHSAVVRCYDALREAGCEIVEVGVDGSGIVDADAWRDALDGRAALANLHHANSETGVVQDVQMLGRMAWDAGCPVHVDAVQSVGKLPLSLGDWPVDFVSVSAHKFHGPAGVGALYVRRPGTLRGLIPGVQESGMRGGTENGVGIVGMGLAAAHCEKVLGEIDRIGVLRDALETGIRKVIPEVVIHGEGVQRICNTASIGFPDIEAEALLILLNGHDVFASAGAACSSGSLEASPVLQAMAVPERVARGTIRFSLSRNTTAQEVSRVIEILPALYGRLRDSA